MEPLCKLVDEEFRINLESEEIQDIVKAIDIMVRRFVKYLHDVNTEIKIERLEFIGSMAEDTRIWVPQSQTGKCDIEFDYLVVIKSWPGCGDFTFFPSYEEGKMQIGHTVTDQQSVNGKCIYLEPAIKLSFINTVLRGISAKCERNTCTRQLSNISVVHGCQCCTVYMKTGNLRSTDVPVLNTKAKKDSVLSFVWSSITRSVDNPFIGPNRLPNMSPDGSAVDMIRIKVDFNPVFEVNNEMIVRKDDGTEIPLEESDIYFLFPYLTSYVNWRISTCHSELKHLKESSKEHKLAFCVLKFIGKAFQFYGHIEYVKSYEAKCIVINHIRNCRAPNRGAHMCLLDMIKDIYECARYRNLPHPVLPSCNVYHMDFCSYKDILEQKTPDITIFRKSLFSLLDKQEHVSLEDLYYDIMSLRKLYEKFSMTQDNHLYVDFLQKRKGSSAKEVYAGESISIVLLHSIIKKLKEKCYLVTRKNSN